MSPAPLPFELDYLREVTAETTMKYRKCNMGWLVKCSERRGWLLEWAFESWNPTVNREQAFMVLDKLSEDWVIFIEGGMNSSLGIIHPDGRSETLVEAENLPLGICRLALYLSKMPLVQLG